MSDATTPTPAFARAALLARLRAATIAMLGAAVRSVLMAAGSASVTRGVLDQGTIDGYPATAVELVVGAILAGRAFG